MALPQGCKLVGVELIDDAIDLPSFRHPLRAAYVLGPEQGSLSDKLLARCDYVVRSRRAFASMWPWPAPSSCTTGRARLARFADRPMREGGPKSPLPAPTRTGGKIGRERMTAARDGAYACANTTLFLGRGASCSTNRIIAAAAITSTLALAGAAAAQTVDLVEQAGRLEPLCRHGDAEAVCFIAAQPQAVEPLGANRGPIFFYISAWPKDGVKTEPSIKVGYPVKPDEGDDGHRRHRHLQAVRQGRARLRLRPDRGAEAGRGLEEGLERRRQGDLGEGTGTTDTYSLSGLGKALDKMADDLPVAQADRSTRPRSVEC